ncbi:hypothetical protein BDW02DRAFT_588426 [Decorospora gaudefroyi]|uniref:LysM domain-containing protein n=1 Tax=Decorospora gaudefroyi TaxID=184978 RepID=A0A6A5KL46_9PLEO|nr:hypothetical protein BDW02DRAFT_588426 [Decorospora gaudefroyi]
MQLTRLFATGLLAGLTLANPAPLPDNGATCESFAASWGISVDDLKRLNPIVSCPNLGPNKECCVMGTVTDDPVSTTTPPTTTKPVPTSTAPSTTTTPSTSTSASSTTTKTSTTTTAGNGVATPMPTQPGMVSNCNRFHYVASGVTCSQILSYQKISLADFAKWNPSVNNDCSGLWAEVNVCVGVIGGTHVTTFTTKPSTTTSAGNGVQTPQPTQPGMVTNCNKFHYVASGVTCSQITSYQKISLSNFVKWNPTVGSDCRSMQAGVNVCVGVIGGTPVTAKPTTTTSAGNGIQTAQPTQPGMAVTCQQIISYQKIILADFVKWNTGVGSNCQTMWAKTHVCVGV